MYEKLTEVKGRSCWHTENWQIVAQKHRKLTEGPVDSRKVEWRSCRYTESWRKVPLMHGMLTDGPTDVQKVYGSSYGCTESWQTLTEGPVDAQKVDGLSLGCTEGWQKLTECPYAFRQLSVRSNDYRSIFHVSAGFSFTFHQLPSTSRAPAGASIINLHGRRTFCHHQSTFCASAGLIVNLRLLFVTPADLLPTFRMSGWPSVSISCVHRTCQLCSTSLNYSVVQAVQQRFLSRTHEIFSYDPCYFHYSVVPAVRLSWTFLKYRKTLLLSLFPNLLSSSSSWEGWNNPVLMKYSLMILVITIT